MSAAAAGVTCVLNARAGAHNLHELTEHVARLFSDRDCPARILVATNGDELLAHIRGAVEWGRTVVAGGGDGTVNAVASALVGTDRVLGILPLGTLNHFARDLGLPLDLPGAVETVITGRVKAVDVGEVNGQPFLNNSSVGTYSQLVLGRESEQHRGHGKAVAFAIAALRVLAHHSVLKVRLQVDGIEDEERRTPLLFIGNNAYTLNGLKIGERTRLDTGRLFMCLVPDADFGSEFQLALRVLADRLRNSDLEVRDATELRVETARHFVDVARDGEVTRLASPLHYRVRPKALHVLVPGPSRGFEPSGV